MVPHGHAYRQQMMRYSVSISGNKALRTTINIDGELPAKATKLAGAIDGATQASEGLKACIARESAKRPARLGGTQPGLKAAPRRRQGGPV